MAKIDVIKNLVKAGYGLPNSVKIYNYLSCNGEIVVDVVELKSYIENH